jgi:glycosyltransferase involved in cell wall biosynthesis
LKQSSLAILQIIPRLDAGGAERTTIDIAAALGDAGHIALVASEGGRLEPELRATGATLLRLPVASKNPLTIFRNIRRLKNIITEHRVTLIHARSRAPAWSALYAAKQAGIPFVTTHHGTYAARNAWKRWYNSVMFRGNAIIANSEWTADCIRNNHAASPKRLVTIPRGIDLTLFDPSRFTNQDRNELRTAWGASVQSCVVLLPGRLTRWKGQLVLIEALSRLSEAGNLPAGLRVVIAGDAQGRKSYAEEIKNAVTKAELKEIVTLPGHISHMAPAYLAADIVISTSTEPEAFGRIAVEAGAMGRPVIATDHGGARETIMPGESGLLVPPGDPSALCDALVRLLGVSQVERREMGIKARAYVGARYSIEKMCANTIGLYLFLVKSHGIS